MEYRQIDCLKIHMTFLKILAIWPGDNPSRYYICYSTVFIFVFVFMFLLLYTLNFYFVPLQLEVLADDVLLYFAEIALCSKTVAFIIKRDKFKEIMHTLESDIFQSHSDEELEIIRKAKKTTIMFWKITAVISVIANSANVLTPLLVHLIFQIDIELPVCRYSFIPEKYMASLLYPMYWYQSIGITCHMLYNVNLNCLFMGLIFLTIAQLDILDGRLRKVTDISKGSHKVRRVNDKYVEDQNAVLEINKCIKHFDAICKFYDLIREAFSETLFVQFSLGSIIICVCLFRFTLYATTPYYMFLTLFMAAMILQILVPCWFGSQVIEKSNRISFAVYACDWTPRCRRFKSNMRLLAVRANKPLTITAGKMFLLSLSTFTAIMNSAYSFFTLLRHMQSR